MKKMYSKIGLVLVAIVTLLVSACETVIPTEAPQISEVEIIARGVNSVTVSAQFYDGHHKFIDTGFCYNTIGAPTINDTCYSFGESISDLQATITDLTDATTYYIKAYAKAAEGVVFYSEMSTLITTDYIIEPQSCLSLINSFAISVSIKAIFEFDETSKINDMGIIFNTENDPKGANAIKYQIPVQRNMIDLVYSGLEPGTNYYAWSYIDSEECGVKYSRENKFTTLDNMLSVKFNEYNSSRWLVGMHHASVKCFIDYDGSNGNTLVEAGLMWSKREGAKLDDEGVEKITDSRIVDRGSYTICATGLMSGTTYYFRAYTRLSNGSTDYSDDISITTYKHNDCQSMVATGSLCSFNVGAPTKNRYWVWSNNSDYNTSRQKNDPVWGGLKGMKEAFEKDGYSFSSGSTFKERCTWIFSINKEKDTLLVIRFAYNDLPRTVEADSKYYALFGWKVKTNQANGQIICTDMAYKEANYPTISSTSKYYKNAETLMNGEHTGPMLRAYFEFLFGSEEEPHPLQMDVHSINKSSGSYEGRFIMMPISQKRNPDYDYFRNGAEWGSFSNMPLPIWSE